MDVCRYDWIFLEAKKGYHVLEPNNYVWDFELVLPDTLPETINLTQGFVEYNLKATVERCAFARNLNVRRKIQIRRYSKPNPMKPIRNTPALRTRDGINYYEVSIESKPCNLDDWIPIDILLRPLMPNLKIHRIIYELRQLI